MGNVWLQSTFEYWLNYKYILWNEVSIQLPPFEATSVSGAVVASAVILGQVTNGFTLCALLQKVIAADIVQAVSETGSSTNSAGTLQ